MSTNLILQIQGQTLTFGVPIPCSASGQSNTGANVGAGAGVFRDKTGAVLNLRSVVGGAGITATENANDVEVAADFGATSGKVTQGNDTRIPAQDENDALLGNNGTPSDSNRYVTESGQAAEHTETGGPQRLAYGAWPDGHFGRRAGTDIVGSVVPMAAASNGYLTGCEASINGGDAAKFDLESGTCCVVDWRVPGAPVLRELAYTGVTAEDPPDVVGSDFTRLGLRDSGDHVNAVLVMKDNANWTPEELRYTVNLQALGHIGPVINGLTFDAHLGYQVIDSLRDLAFSRGPVTTGNRFIPNGANLFLTKEVGTTEGFMFASITNPQNPNEQANAAVPTVGALFRGYRDGAGGFISTQHFGGAAVVDPNFYDDGSIALAGMPTGKYQIQHIRTAGVAGALPVMIYGQKLYNTAAAARADLISQGTIINPISITGGSLVNWLILKEGATALNNIAEAEFVIPPVL